MKPIIHTINKKDFNITENLTREAFWNVYKPGCDEHLVLNKLRNSKSYISKLDLVAVFENRIVGHIISTKAKVIDLHHMKQMQVYRKQKTNSILPTAPPTIGTK